MTMGETLISFSLSWGLCESTLRDKVQSAKKFYRSAFTRGANQSLHVIEVALQSATARSRQPIFRLGQPAIERFCANDIVAFFELAGVHAEVAVGRLEHGFQLVESERTVHGQRAYDP